MYSNRDIQVPSLGRGEVGGKEEGCGERRFAMRLVGGACFVTPALAADQLASCKVTPSTFRLTL